jgi:Dolichyl-phosphate-mannose-protein mannosyltransferase
MSRVIRMQPAGRQTEPAGGIWRVLAFCFLVLFALHVSLLRLPYFWDEAGYFIPAARDLLLHGDLIPQSTLSNAHPPLVMLWLAAAWKVFGYSTLVSRTAMLGVAALALAGVYRLARMVSNSEVAIGTAICTLLFPVFFAQSTMAHLDMAAAAFTLWGLIFYLRQRRLPTILLFALAGLAKETAILTPLALMGWETACRLARRFLPEEEALEHFPAQPPSRWAALWRACALPQTTWRQTAFLLLALVPLAAWFAYHYARTGYVFGNPEFVRYNLSANFSPLRFLLALLTRVWHLLGYMNLFVLTLATLLAMRLPPLSELPRARHKAGGNGERRLERPRIALPTQAVFAVLILAHLLAFALLGGAVLARYLLPVYPLVILICVSTLWRRVPWWPAYLLLVCIGFAIALLIPPPYRAAPEDSLGYVRAVRLQQAAAQVAERMAYPATGKANPAENPDTPTVRVLTAWPVSDELTKPYLGYVTRPVPVAQIDNFSTEQLMRARAELNFDAALLFSTKYEPPYRLLPRLRFWESIQHEYFDEHYDLEPAVAAQILDGRVIYEQSRGGQWVAIVRRERIENASLRTP